MRGVLGDAPLLERQATRANLPIYFVKHRFGGGHRVLRIQRQDDDFLYAFISDALQYRADGGILVAHGPIYFECLRAVMRVQMLLQGARLRLRDGLERCAIFGRDVVVPNHLIQRYEPRRTAT